ncbi:hypothetical protein [Streptomyces olindensis]|uniref:hypothetical protein n=1 Tax=Streptomyces olindensis TaxID=358823 RepID=UPI0036544B78
MQTPRPGHHSPIRHGPALPRRQPRQPAPRPSHARADPHRSCALIAQSPAPNGTERNPSPHHDRTVLNPDFELYDNVGRTAEQIRAYHTRSATTNDLYRWAKRDAQAFRAQHRLPDEALPAPDLAPYLTALTAAKTPAEFSTVTNALLDAAEPLLNTVVDYLAAAAQWRRQNRGAAPGSPPTLLRDAASRIKTALAMAADADLQLLRAHYDPPPDLDVLTQQAHSKPVPPPPGPQPAPGRTRN